MLDGKVYPFAYDYILNEGRCENHDHQDMFKLIYLHVALKIFFAPLILSPRLKFRDHYPHLADIENPRTWKRRHDRLLLQAIDLQTSHTSTP